MINKIKNFFEKYSGSEKFWNTMFIILVISISSSGILVAMLVAIITSWLDLMNRIVYDKYQFGFIVSPISWVFGIVVLILGTVRYINIKFIIPFNNWLDEKLK